MTRQTEIIRACTHEPKPCDTTAGLCCSDCWNASVYARRADRRAELAASLAAGKLEGARYWEARGVRVGQTVYRVARSMLNPLATVRVEGRACVNRGGAYVRSAAQRGELAPEGWTP